MANLKTTKRLRVLNSIIINKALNHSAFALYVELRRRAFDDRVSFYPQELKEKLGWRDNRTLKKHLNALCEHGAIKESVERIVNHKRIEVSLVQFTKNFTQVDIDTIERIKQYTQTVEIEGHKGLMNVSVVALRLFFYYEKNYNSNFGYAFPTYKNIQDAIGIRPAYIKAINTVFHDCGLVDVSGGDWYTVELEDKFMVRRSNNKYVPNCSRVASG